LYVTFSHLLDNLRQSEDADLTTYQAYANMVWGFANVTISTNLARDLGTRIVAAIFFGGDAFNKYAPIAILVNVPATLYVLGENSRF